jgi:hypothetical protein
MILLGYFFLQDLCVLLKLGFFSDQFAYLTIEYLPLASKHSILYIPPIDPIQIQSIQYLRFVPLHLIKRSYLFLQHLILKIPDKS